MIKAITFLALAATAAVYAQRAVLEFQNPGETTCTIEKAGGALEASCGGTPVDLIAQDPTIAVLQEGQDALQDAVQNIHDTVCQDHLHSSTTMAHGGDFTHSTRTFCQYNCVAGRYSNSDQCDACRTECPNNGYELGAACDGSGTNNRVCTACDASLLPSRGSPSFSSQTTCEWTCGSGYRKQGSSDCVRDCVGSWDSNWGSCQFDSGSCGTGKKYKNYNVITPQDGGSPCSIPDAVGSTIWEEWSLHGYQSETCSATCYPIRVSGDNDNSATNLAQCTGECDADHQCAAGLECFQRSNGEEIPGCDVKGAPSGGWDYCYNPDSTLAIIPVSGDNDNSATNLARCTGECDDDHQCAAGLECFQRSNGEEIPGCDVTDAPSGGWDYCYKP